MSNLILTKKIKSHRKQQDVLISKLPSNTIRWIKTRRALEGASHRVVVSQSRVVKLREIFNCLDYESRGFIRINDISLVQKYSLSNNYDEQTNNLISNIMKLFENIYHDEKKNLRNNNTNTSIMNSNNNNNNTNNDNNHSITISFKDFMIAMTGNSKSIIEKSNEDEFEKLRRVFADYAQHKRRVNSTQAIMSQINHYPNQSNPNNQSNPYNQSIRQNLNSNNSNSNGNGSSNTSDGSNRNNNNINNIITTTTITTTTPTTTTTITTTSNRHSPGANTITTSKVSDLKLYSNFLTLLSSAVPDSNNSNSSSSSSSSHNKKKKYRGLTGLNTHHDELIPEVNDSNDNTSNTNNNNNNNTSGNSSSNSNSSSHNNNNHKNNDDDFALVENRLKTVFVDLNPVQIDRIVTNERHFINRMKELSLFQQEQEALHSTIKNGNCNNNNNSSSSSNSSNNCDNNNTNISNNNNSSSSDNNSSINNYNNHSDCNTVSPSYKKPLPYYTANTITLPSLRATISNTNNTTSNTSTITTTHTTTSSSSNTAFINSNSMNNINTTITSNNNNTNTISTATATSTIMKQDHHHYHHHRTWMPTLGFHTKTKSSLKLHQLAIKDARTCHPKITINNMM